MFPKYTTSPLPTHTYIPVNLSLRLLPTKQISKGNRFCVNLPINTKDTHVSTIWNVFWKDLCKTYFLWTWYCIESLEGAQCLFSLKGSWHGHTEKRRANRKPCHFGGVAWFLHILGIRWPFWKKKKKHWLCQQLLSSFMLSITEVELRTILASRNNPSGGNALTLRVPWHQTTSTCRKQTKSVHLSCW